MFGFNRDEHRDLLVEQGNFLDRSARAIGLKRDKFITRLVREILKKHGSFRTRIEQDLMGYLQKRKNVDLEDIDHLKPLNSIDLSKAHTDKLIYRRGGAKIFVTSLTGTAFVRTRIAGEKYHLFSGTLSFPFNKLYLTNTAQAGKTLDMTIGLVSFVDLNKQPEFTPTEKVKLQNIAEAVINPARKEDIEALKTYLAGGYQDPKGLCDIHRMIRGLTYHGVEMDNGVPRGLYDIETKINQVYATQMAHFANKYLYNVTMTLADTEYTQALGGYGSRWALAQTRGGTEWRYSHLTGKVAAPTEPYWTVKANTPFILEYTKGFDNDIYCACATPGEVLEIRDYH